MRLLLDTHFVLAFLRKDFPSRFPRFSQFFDEADIDGFVSVASLWEIAIKWRLGKLDPGMALDDMPSVLQASGLTIMPIGVPHVIKAVEPEPGTRDPFDRLLLGQCQAEGLLLVTVDRLLADHRLAFRF
ncbi:type II toxin-antitoxin system VapC family toxin [Pseudorhizobium endolithicum]|uniref:Type II toxin-antitoxin system VapC family toxin n=1 Tax=Pseudorhizobium endolithicum TaxID=1191678 RepID=A0ABN7JIL6_9HYPH|nr:type II toxin-antitoxin system VapC family toxin [Pseudorhizobium endolithicum]CAD6410569.1 type II toxin-antitoxin system VapC family toxin [Rhizobium sp. Q54]CAD7024008.1 type II toxin-antitoxin system VapC family toxin [Pseudorhizobium endolithicum]